MSATKVLKVDPLRPDPKLIREAASVISQGGLAIIPTDTVYGLAADSRNGSAVKKLSEVKKRPKDKPFPLLVNQKEHIETNARNVPPAAYKLARRFWPGPLTMVLEAKDGGTACGERSRTVGLRMPESPVALGIIAEVGGPLACPSANISGKAPPRDLDSALKELEGKVELAIDAGPCKLGLESTVIDLTAGPPRVLREGVIKKQDIDSVIGKKTVLFVCTGNSCRSVMAEGLLKKILKEKNRDDVEVFSAGVTPVEGMGATAETAELLADESIDISAHRAQRLTRELIHASDIILVMGRSQEQAVMDLAPEAQNRLFLLKEFAKINDEDMNIGDPIGRGRDFYSRTFYIIRQAVERVAQVL